jgi:integrase
VPLVPEAVKILEIVLAHYPGKSGDYLFSGTDGRKPVFGWSKAQRRMLKACLEETGEIPKVRWTPHDLRRTVATRIAEQLGIEGEKFVKRVLGHSDGSVTAIYNRYGYVKEMRRVLELWVKELTADVTSNAVEEPIAA